MEIKLVPLPNLTLYFLSELLESLLVSNRSASLLIFDVREIRLILGGFKLKKIKTNNLCLIMILDLYQ